MKKFTKKTALAFGALLMAAGINTTKAQTGAALSFDGVNDIVNVGTNLTNAVGTSSVLTLEAWVRPTTTSGTGAIISNHNTNSSFALRRNGAAYDAFIGFGTHVITAPNTVTLNTWQHVAMVFQSTSLRLYINGSLVATTAFATYTLPSNSIGNATVQIGNNGFSEAFGGEIDEVRVWKAARTQCEICNFMNCEIPNNATTLLANYHFNQGIASVNNSTVTTLTDATTSAFNGTLTNFALTGATGNWVAPGGVISSFTTSGTTVLKPGSSISTCLNNTVSFTAYPAVSYTWTGGISTGVPFTATATTSYSAAAIVTAAPGCTFTAVASVSTTNCPGAALAFDGANDIVNIGTSLTNSVGTSTVLTLEAWVRPTTNSGVGSIISNHNTNSSFALRRNGNGYDAFVGFGTHVITVANTVTLNTWQHVAMVFQSTSLRLYVNGNLAGTLAIPSYTLPANSIGNASVQIGNNGFIEPFGGEIDEVRVWKTARTQCEINSYKNCEIPSNATNLLANYHFNQGQAFSSNTTFTTLTDATTNAFTGTLTNMALTSGNVTSNWVSPGGVVSGYSTTTVPTFTNSALSICPGGTVVLGSTGATSFTWNPSITNNVAFTPTASASYSYAGTNTVTTCSNTMVANVIMNTNPTVTAVTSQTNLICVGQTATLTASGANTYAWNTTATTAVIAVSPTTTTTYTVVGTNTSGCSNAATITQSVSTCSGINAVSAQESVVEIYPNPSTGVFNLKISSEMTIQVLDILGSKILETKLQIGDYKLNLSEYNNGMYIVKCTSQGQIKSYKLIKD